MPVNSTKSVFEKQPSDEKINLILAVLTQRTVDSGHCVQFEKKYYRMLDSNEKQIHYRKGTKVMVVRAFDGSLYCTVNDKDIYALEEISKQAEKSRNFDTDFKERKPKKTYIPPMNHPWRSKAFFCFVRAQKHHRMDDMPA